MIGKGTFGSEEKLTMLTMLQEKINSLELRKQHKITSCMSAICMDCVELSNIDNKKFRERMVMLMKTEYKKRIDSFSDNYEYGLISRLKNFSNAKFNNILKSCK